MGSQTQARGFWKTGQMFSKRFLETGNEEQGFFDPDMLKGRRSYARCVLRMVCKSTEAIGKSAASMRASRLGGTEVHERMSWEMERFPGRAQSRKPYGPNHQRT
jgi:hypothetical protein